ncbi:hypothetical protein AHAS_Ahas17G0244000 [Arachis hypogaea]
MRSAVVAGAIVSDLLDLVAKAVVSDQYCSLEFRYVYRKFSQHYKAIIGADFVTKELQVDDSSLYRFGIQQDKKGSIV